MSLKSYITFSIALTLSLICLNFTQAEDWLAFRGTTQSSVTENSLPSALDEKSIAWKANLEGRGLSSPIIVKDQVFITSGEGVRQDKLAVTSFSVSDGKVLWRRTFRATGRSSSHPKTCNAAPTPASNGNVIVATFSSNDVICLNLKGETVWVRGLNYDFPNASNSLGMSSSPVIAGNTAVCMVENDDDSFTIGLNLATGETLWKINRPRAANWTSPYVFNSKEKKTLVLLQSSKGVDAIDPENGHILWSYQDGASTIPSGTASNGIAYIPSNGVTAIKPGVSETNTVEIVWQQSAASPGTSSIVVLKDVVYAVNNSGVLVGLNIKDGEKLFQFRLQGKYSGTPLIAGDHLYIPEESGILKVVKLDKEPKIVSTLELKDTILSSPATDGKSLFVRSDKHLWKICK